MIEIVNSVAGVAAGTKGWFVDIWGVMHNGVAPFQSAVAACQMFRRSGGFVVLVSNAPRPNPGIRTQLDRIGVPHSAYDAIVSSGDTSRALISALGATPIYHLGPDRDLTLYDGLSVTLVGANAAQAIVCTGLFDDETQTPQDYAAELSNCAARGVEMICANPDLAVDRGGRIIPCAGEVAAHYEQLGGRVSYAGKPYLPIYETAFGLIDRLAGHPIGKANIIAIGDGIKTDIAGAAHAGIASIYIASSIHLGASTLDAQSLARLFPDPAIRPIAAMTSLAW